jgi:hypothetical protein
VTVTHGTNVVLGLDPARLADVRPLLARRGPVGRPPLWDGGAGPRAATEIEWFLGVGVRRRRPVPRRLVAAATSLATAVRYAAS